MSEAPPGADDVAYFERIETRFAQLRGTPLLLSPKDWALVASWHRRGIPVRIVLEALETVFRSRADAASRPVVSLGYCRHAVEAAYAEWNESRLGAPGAGGDPGGESLLSAEEAATSLESWAREIETAARRASLDPSLFEDTTAALTRLARAVLSEPEPGLTGLEERLERLEDALLDRLLAAADAERRAEIESRVHDRLAPLASRLTARAYESTRLSHLRAQVRDTYGLPRLTLYPI